MPDFKFIYGKQSELATVPSYPGAIIITDAARMYIDGPDGSPRCELTTIRVIRTETDRAAIMTPLDGFYYVRDSNKLYHYIAPAWFCLNPEDDFIGADGKILSDYLAGYGNADGWPGEPGAPGSTGNPGKPGDVVLLGPGGVVPEGYMAIATASTRGSVRLGAVGGAARYGKPEDVGLDKVSNAVQVKVTDIETSIPNSHSPHSAITSAKVLYQMLGGSVSELATDDQTIIGAINELYTLISEK